MYYDSSCPLCRAEIGYYRRQDQSSALCFIDVSKLDALVPVGLARQRAMERFHVQKEDGQMLYGAAAFVEVWARLPRWRWVARAATLPGIMALLEFTYRLFLPVRPALAVILGGMKRLRDALWASRRHDGI